MAAERSALVTGVGCSAIGRRLQRDPLTLTVDASLAAIADAGLTPDDIDGVATYPGAIGKTPGITGAGVDDVRALLGLSLRWYAGGGEVPGQLGAVVNAILAVHAGVADHVLVFRTVWEATAQERAGGRGATIRQGQSWAASEWASPYGVGYATYGALDMQRYLHESGATREQLGQIAVVSRTNAIHNPLAVYREPLSIDDYLAARMISDPLCLYDCDVPVDGSIALVISRASAAVDRPRSVAIQAIGSASGFEAAADMMWSRTELTPADIDVAELYDGFSILAVRWLEALGLCPHNETGPFVEGGKRIALDGELPLNTNGGQLSAGRLHGFGGIHEACVQLRGTAGDHQVYPRPDVAVVSSGAESFTSCLLLTS